MALDPDFIKKIQERKAKREALEKKVGSKPVSSRGSKGSKKSGGPKGPVFRSVSLLSGKETYITGEDAQKRVEKAKYHG